MPAENSVSPFSRISFAASTAATFATTSFLIRLLLEAGTPVIATKIDLALLRELSLLTAKPYIYVFNCDADELADEALKTEMRELVAPAEAIFLDAKGEA